MIYVGYTLVALLAIAILFVIIDLIYCHYRKHYTEILTDIVFYYLGKSHIYPTGETMYILQSTQTGIVVTMSKEVLDKNFRSDKK